MKDSWTQSPLPVTSQKRHPYFPSFGVSHTPASRTYPSTMNMMVPAQIAYDVTLTQTVTLKGLPVSERCVLTYSYADFPAGVQSCFLLEMRGGYKPGECLTDQLIPPLSSGIRQLAHHTEASVEWQPHPIPSAPPRVDPVLNSRRQTVPSVTTCGT